ncbi:MAG: hypothetical protein FJX35_12990 [Alphaproteobacteria bacterium]|nr:hypothetical protein [Alphaproteobacteria bacterium]
MPRRFTHCLAGSILLLATCAALSQGSAQTQSRTQAQAVPGAADCAPPGLELDQWLIGTWRSAATSQTLEFRRDGPAIAWTYTRERMASSNPMWGEKAAIVAGGHVAVLSSCAFELRGMYLKSENPRQHGRAMRFDLARVPSGRLIGSIIGMAGTPVQIALQRAD